MNRPRLDDPLALVLILMWVAGVVIASGFWSTLFALCFPFWSWYLVIELIMQIYSII